MEHYCLCFSNLPFCFVQDVWDDLFPAPGERSEDLCLWLWSPDSWWEGWRDHHWSGEPLPVSIQLLLWPTTDLLHVCENVWVLAGHLIQTDTQTGFLAIFNLSFSILLPLQFWYQPVEGPAEAIPDSGEPGSSERLVQAQDWRQRHITPLQWQRVHAGWIW